MPLGSTPNFWSTPPPTSLAISKAPTFSRSDMDHRALSPSPFPQEPPHQALGGRPSLMAQISKHRNGTGVVSHSSCRPPAVIWASPTPGTLQASWQVCSQIHQHHPSWLPVSAGRRTANLLFHQGWDCLFHQRTPQPKGLALHSDGVSVGFTNKELRPQF